MTRSDDGDVLGTGREVPTRLGRLSVRDVGSGSPAVLWHSLFLDSTTWSRVAARLRTERRLVLIDGPGHGRSRGPDHDYSLDDCVGAACDVLQHLGVEGPVDWLGNAWGGHVGILLAAAQPERVRSLVAVGAPVHAFEPEMRRKMRASLPVYRLFGPIGFLVRGYTGSLMDLEHDDPADVGLVQESFRRADRRGMYRAMATLPFSRPDLAPYLPSVTPPTLFVTGQDDQLCRPDQIQAAARRLPDGAAVVLPGAGHVAPLLRSAGPLAGLVIRFWRDPAGVVGSLRETSRPGVG